MAMTVALYDWNYRPQGQVIEFTSCSVDWLYLDVGTGQLVINESSKFAPMLLSSYSSPVLVKVVVNDIPWVGRVAAVDLDRKGKRGTGDITASLVHESIWLKYLLASQNGANPSLTGMPQYDTQTGPAATVGAYFINAAATRLGVPVLASAPDDDTTGEVTLQGRLPITVGDLIMPSLVAEGVILDVDIVTSRALIPDDQPQPAVLPWVQFNLRQAARDPKLRWSDASNQLSEVHLTGTAATGYRATVGLGGDGTAATYDVVTDVRPEGNGGPYALPEIFVDSSGTSEGTTSQQAGMNELINHRPQLGLTFSVIDGRPWSFGTHYLSGDQAAVTLSGLALIDRLVKVNATYDATNGLVITPTLGDLAVDEASEVLILRAVASVRTQMSKLLASR